MPTLFLLATFLSLSFFVFSHVLLTPTSQRKMTAYTATPTPKITNWFMLNCAKTIYTRGRHPTRPVPAMWTLPGFFFSFLLQLEAWHDIKKTEDRHRHCFELSHRRSSRHTGPLYLQGSPAAPPVKSRQTFVRPPLLRAADHPACGHLTGRLTPPTHTLLLCDTRRATCAFLTPEEAPSGRLIPLITF